MLHVGEMAAVMWLMAAAQDLAALRQPDHVCVNGGAV
jgi:hypothetical protein